MPVDNGSNTECLALVLCEECGVNLMPDHDAVLVVYRDEIHRFCGPKHAAAGLLKLEERSSSSS
jgi:hypothetical protein